MARRKQVRALGSARLSRKTDESTSIERQTEQITLTARIRGDELITITTDTDVSGGISPFLREGLGPWLTDPEKISQWDVLIVGKLDRLTRSLRDFDDLVKWCDAHKKTLVSVSESLDLSTSTGRFSATMLAMFAQFERERIAERRREAAVKIRDNGWWAGFGYPYGSRPVKVDNHWETEINPDTYARLEDMAYDILRGHSVSSIAKSLNARDVPTPAGGKEWLQNTIRDIFNGEKCVLEPELLAQVRDTLDRTKQAWVKRSDCSLLLNIAHCPCGAQYYSKRYTSKGYLYEYYDCSDKCGNRRVPMAMIDGTVNAFMTSVLAEHGDTLSFGKLPMYRKLVSEGTSIRTELQKIERRLHSLDFDAPDFQEVQAELLAERKRLQLEARKPGKTRYEKVKGMRVADYWQTLDKTAKRQLLLEAGITVHVTELLPGWKAGIRIAVDAPLDVRFVILPEVGVSVESETARSG